MPSAKMIKRVIVREAQVEKKIFSCMRSVYFIVDFRMKNKGKVIISSTLGTQLKFLGDFKNNL